MDALLGLLNNAALLLATVVLVDMVASDPRSDSRLPRILAGAVIGVIGCALMLTPWPLLSGVMFDTRSVLLSVTGLFLGTLPTVIAALITSALRLYQGGVGSEPASW